MNDDQQNMNLSKIGAQEFVGLAVLGVLSECTIWGYQILNGALSAELKRADIIPIETGGKCCTNFAVFTFEVQDRNKLIQCLQKAMSSWGLLPYCEIAYYDSAELYWRKVRSTSPTEFTIYLEGDGNPAIKAMQERVDFLKRFYQAWSKRNPEA